MSRTKKLYPSGQNRGGTPGRSTDTGFGAKGNLHRTAKNYGKVSAAAPKP